MHFVAAIAEQETAFLGCWRLLSLCGGFSTAQKAHPCGERRSGKTFETAGTALTRLDETTNADCKRLKSASYTRLVAASGRKRRCDGRRETAVDSCETLARRRRLTSESKRLHCRLLQPERRGRGLTSEGCFETARPPPYALRTSDGRDKARAAESGLFAAERGVRERANPGAKK